MDSLLRSLIGFVHILGLTFGWSYFCFGKSNQNRCPSQNSSNTENYQNNRRNINLQILRHDWLMPQTIAKDDSAYQIFRKSLTSNCPMDGRIIEIEKLILQTL